MSKLTVQLSETPQKGRVYIGDANQPQAEMTFSKAGDGLIIIDHTEVSDELRGQGIGRKLLDVVVKLARTQGKKILPLCPYAKNVFGKDLAIRDVLKNN